MSKRRKHQARQAFADGFLEEDEQLQFNLTKLMSAIASGQLADDPDAEAVAAALVYDWLRGVAKEPDPEREKLPESIQKFFKDLASWEGDPGPEEIPALIEFLKSGFAQLLIPVDGQHR